MVSSVAVCCVRPTAHALLCIVNGDDSAVFVFFVPGDLELWPLTLTFEFGRDFCTMHLTAKFHRPTFNRSEVIVLTKNFKLTNWQTNRRRWKHPPRSGMLRRCVIRAKLRLHDTAGCITGSHRVDGFFTRRFTSALKLRYCYVHCWNQIVIIESNFRRVF